ncbi:MAG: hypothetical protein ACK2T3_12765, partial [Candidatus Promineifilaceae bacterium]
IFIASSLVDTNDSSVDAVAEARKLYRKKKYEHAVIKFEQDLIGGERLVPFRVRIALDAMGSQSIFQNASTCTRSSPKENMRACPPGRQT